MSPWAVPVVIAVIALIPSVLAYRQSARANKRADDLESRKVDGDALTRAVAIYEGSIKQLQDTVTRLEAQLEKARDSDITLRERIVVLEEKWRTRNGDTKTA